MNTAQVTLLVGGSSNLEVDLRSKYGTARSLRIIGANYSFTRMLDESADPQNAMLGLGSN